MFTKKIYTAHPYGGNPENAAQVEQIVEKLQTKYPHYLFLSPIHSFSFAYHKYSYEYGMAMCLALLSACDELWLFGDWENSRGCQTEHRFADETGIPITIAGDVEQFIKVW